MKAKKRALLSFFVGLIGCLWMRPAAAEDWGAYALIPSGAPGMALEAVGAGTQEETPVSIGRAGNGANQKWFIVPKGDDLYAIHPAYSLTLALSVAKGETRNGAPIVLETDRGQPWQLWALKRNENGSYCLIPKHASDKGLDDFGGRREPGACQDLWTNTPGDSHLQWRIQPLAGTPAAAGGDRGATDYVAPDIQPEAILPGRIRSVVFDRSRIFPGTVRQVTVFIPAQYDGGKPACVYVKTDGYNPIEKSLLERMIAAKEIPVVTLRTL